MTKRLVGRVMWVGRATVFLVGLAVILALVFGVTSTALSATGGNFILGQANGAGSVSKLTASIAGPALTLVNQSTGAAATALNISVASGKAPLKVNATAGTATNLSADKLDGKDSDQFAAAVGGKAADAFNADRAVTAADAEKLDGKDSSEFANATHAHAGEDITSGTVANAHIDGSIARDDEIVPAVKANDGSGSGVDADTIDGKDSSAFYTGRTYVVRETRSGTTRGAAIILKIKCQPGDKVLSGGLAAPFGGTILTDAPGKVNSWGGVDYVQNGDSPDAWVIDWVPNYDSNYPTYGYAVCADLG